MGLFLQKTNIIRDYREDIDDARIFWPKSVWYVNDNTIQIPSSHLLGRFILTNLRTSKKRSMVRQLFIV